MAATTSAQSAPPAPQPWQSAPPAGAPSSDPAYNPMAGQVKAIAVVDITVGALDALVAIAAVFLFGIGSAVLRANERYGVPEWAAASATAIGVLAFVLFGLAALVSLLAGMRLLSFRRSGKGLGIAAAILQILGGLPMVLGGGIGVIGIGVGIWGLVVLNRPDTDRLLVQ